MYSSFKQVINSNSIQFPLLQFVFPLYIWPYTPQFNNLCEYKSQFPVYHNQSQRVSDEVKKQQSEEVNQAVEFLKEQKHKRNQKRKKNAQKKNLDGNYLNKCQKADRNLNSIVLRNFSNFLNCHSNLIGLLNSIISARNFNISAQDYKKKFRQALPLRQAYVGVGKFRDFIDIRDQAQKDNWRQLTLILLRTFIYIEFPLVILNSKKVNKFAKEKQLKHGKKFFMAFLKQYE